MGRVVVASLSLVSVTAGAVHAEPGLSPAVRAQFTRFCDALGVSTGAPTLRRARTWVEAATKDWTLIVDVSGNRIFRPNQMQSWVRVSRKHLVGSEHEKLPLDKAIRDGLVDQARPLALELADVPLDEAMRVYVKREIILVGAPGRRALQRYGGRYLVRLHKKDGSGYFHVVYSPNRRPIRIDTSLWDADDKGLAGALAGNEPDPAIGVYQENRGRLNVGTFFDPTELRFEVRACSFHSEPFLNLSQRDNPFQAEASLDWNTYPPEPQAFRLSDEYRHQCWKLWAEYGRVGAVRGNWLPEKGRFEHGGVKIRYHRSFADYALASGEPTRTFDFVAQDGKTYKLPRAEAAQAERRFYDHIEQCHVVHFSMHGGHVGTRYRFSRNRGIWIKFQPVRPLGSGNLRHLLLEGCGSMTYVEEPDKRVILDTWIEGGLAGGIRTICGSDGGRSGWTSAGWRFYGVYNKGDSICDAWAIRSLDEHPRNSPVTVAYGGTRVAALRTLLDGRFAYGRVKPTWVAVSVWNNPP